MRAIRRLVITGACLVLAAPTFCVTSAVWAGTTAPPDSSGDDATLADDFQAEIEAALHDAGVSGDVISLIGEAGDLDLPPGTLVYTGAVEAADAADVPPGGSSALTGPCQGIAISLGPDGVVDMAADFSDGGPPVDLLDGGQAFTASNPFQVDVDGYVAYAGKADPAPIDHSWYVRVQGLNLDSGGDDNPDEKNRNAGTVDLDNDLPAPAKVNALFKIDGEMSADGGFHCDGEGYIQTVGGLPILGGLGLILFIAAGLGALFNARPAVTWKG